MRSHLLPKALTRTPEPGLPRVDGHDGQRPVRRFDSWFDPSMVTRTGEDILTYYDDWAIKELRRLKLVWSAWGEAEALPTNDIEERTGLRHLESASAPRLRLFFLSLLWRAASTSLQGYRLSLPDNQIEMLRKMIVNKDAAPSGFFPVVLTQLTTKGPWHNAGPRAMSLAPDDQTAPIPFFRFYFEGLIAHIYDDVSGTFAEKLESLALSDDNYINVLTRPFEESAQHDWLQEVITVNVRNHYDEVERIFGRH